MDLKFTTDFTTAYLDSQYKIFSIYGISAFYNINHYNRDKTAFSRKISVRKVKINILKDIYRSNTFTISTEDGEIPYLPYKWAIIRHNEEGAITTGASILFADNRSWARRTKTRVNLKKKRCDIYKAKQNPDGSITFEKTY